MTSAPTSCRPLGSARSKRKRESWKSRRGGGIRGFLTLPCSRGRIFLGPIEAILCLEGFLSLRLSGWSPGMDMATSGIVYATATTMSLAGIVASQVGNVFACRTERESVFSAGFLKPKFRAFRHSGGSSASLMLIYTPVFQRVFGLAPLGPSHWLILAVFPWRFSRLKKYGSS